MCFHQNHHFTANKRLDLEATFLRTYACSQRPSDCRFSSKSSTSLTFILKVNDCRYLVKGDRANIAIANIESRSGLSITRFKFDLGLIHRSTWKLERCLAKYFELLVFFTYAEITSFCFVMHFVLI